MKPNQIWMLNTDRNYSGKICFRESLFLILRKYKMELAYLAPTYLASLHSLHSKMPKFGQIPNWKILSSGKMSVT